MAAATLLACDDPTAIRTAPPAPRQLVIQSILDPDRTTQHVHVEPLSPRHELQNVIGRLYEDGTLVEMDFAASPDSTDPRLGRCGETFDGVPDIASGLCLEFDYWPRTGSEYRVEVGAEGFASAAGSARIPAYFEFTSHDARGTPPGTEGLELSWTASAGADVYLVSVVSGAANCLSAQCYTGWYTDTRELSIATVIPRRELSDGGDSWRIRVHAVEPGLYDYLTTGAQSRYFTVPPIQNVEGGYGVVGAWVVRTIVGDLIEAVVRRGDWNVTGRPLPDTEFHPREAIGSRAGGLYVVEGSNDRLFHWSHATSEWSLVHEGHISPSELATTDRGIVIGTDIGTVLIEDGSVTPRVIPVPWDGLVAAAAFADHDEGLWLFTGWVNPGDPLIMLRSGDDGATFDTIYLPIADELEAGIEDIAEAPDGTLYAPVSTGWADASARPVLRSTDRGVTWDVLQGTVPGDASNIEVGSDGRLYMGIADISPGIYVSADGGVSWTRTRFERVRELIVDPVTPGRLWFSTVRNFLDGAPGGVFESTDGGITFVSRALEHAQTLGLLYHPSDRKLFTVERSRGVLVLDIQQPGG